MKYIASLVMSESITSRPVPYLRNFRSQDSILAELEDINVALAQAGRGNRPGGEEERRAFTS